MSEYQNLAHFYDRLTGDVDYAAFADYYEEHFRRAGLSVRTILDLACGTGTLTWELARRGYELIGADMSAEMLSEAQSKSGTCSVPVPPLWLEQSMAELDLYGTVDAEICSLDGINYACPEELEEIFHRLWLFLEPGGMLIFDVIPPRLLRAYDGETFIDETEEVFCVWRAEFDAALNACCYGMDLFSCGADGRWDRSFEEHIEYAHDPAMLAGALEKAGFTGISLFGKLSFTAPGEEDDRLFITARKPKMNA